MPRSLTRSPLLDIAVRSALVAGSLAAAVPVMAAQDGALDEVVVTARKRTETLQDIPLAVSAIDGATLQAQGIANITDTYSRVPNLYFTASGGASPTSDYQYLTIRGVGFNGGLEPAVGVFIDGMYQPQIGFDTSFLDAERVEVLRGPQGTLFGRNTQGGAVNIVTRKPGSEFGGRVELEGGQPLGSGDRQLVRRAQPAVRVHRWLRPQHHAQTRLFHRATGGAGHARMVAERATHRHVDRRCEPP
jgi:iron complex outermembrane receptor protein